MALLLLHAAGVHRLSSTNNTLSHVVSSYAPTLNALQFSRGKLWTSMIVENNKILIVGMLKTPDHENLNVSDEITAIRRYVGSSAIVEILTASTAAIVLQKITTCSFVHFACHGFSNATKSSKSALLLATKLIVDDLQSLNHQLVQVAYLSAYSMAKIGVRSLIDESIHLANIF